MEQLWRYSRGEHDQNLENPNSLSNVIASRPLLRVRTLAENKRNVG